MAEEVADLFAKLSLKFDKNLWVTADDYLKAIEGRFKKLQLDAAFASTDVNKALSTIGLPGAPGLVGGPAEGLKKVGGSVIGTLAKVAAAFAVGAAVRGIEGWIHSTADLASNAIDTADKLGITSESVQELGYAAKLSSADQETLVAGLGKLQSGLNKLTTKGEGPAATALQKLGINFQQLKGHALDDNLELIADKFAAMPNGIEKATAATQLFGGAGRKLIPFLNNGSKGIIELRNEAHRLGIVIGDDAAHALKDFNDEQDKLKFATAGLKQEVAVALLPAFREIVVGLREWIMQNRELIKSTIVGFVHGMITAFHGLALVVRTIIIPVVQFFVEHMEITKAALLALGVAMLVFGLKAAQAWVMAAWLPLLVVAAITAVVLAVMELIDHWGDIKRVAKETWEAIVGWLSGVWDKVKSTGDRIRDFFVDTAVSIRDAFEGVAIEIKDFFVGIVDGILSTVENMVNDAIGLLNHLPFVDIGEVKLGRVGEDSQLNADAMKAFDSAAGPDTPTRDNQAVANNVDVKMGDIHVTAPAGADPQEFAEAMRPHVRDMLDDEYRKAMT